MAKVTYEFDLYEDRNDAQQHAHCHEAFMVLWDIDQAIRNRLKHGPEMDASAALFLEGLRDQITPLTNLVE